MKYAFLPSDKREENHKKREALYDESYDISLIS